MCLSILGLHDLITLHSMAFLLYRLKCFLEISITEKNISHVFFFFQLEEKLKEKVDLELAEKIELNGEQDVFHR